MRLRVSIMATNQFPNRYTVQHGLDNYRGAMRSFIMNGLGALLGTSPGEAIRNALRGKAASDFHNRITQGKMEIPDAFDEGQFPHIVRHYWDATFKERVVDSDNVRRNFIKWLWEVARFRNATAHPSSNDMSVELVQECFERISQVLRGINALSAESATQKLVDTLTAQNLASTSGPQDSDRETANSLQSTTVVSSGRANRRQSGGTEQAAAQGRPLRRPWREVIQPHPDVVHGTMQPSEFAADLQQVYDGLADDNLYGNPVLFFRHTYMTDGIRDLLTATVQRLAGNGGYPVVQAKTGFGGGKTHSLIALYHLVSSANELVNADGDTRDEVAREEMRAIMNDAGISLDEGIRVSIAVLNGIHLSPTDDDVTHEKSDPLHTLWGVMAYQLGGQAGYDIIGGAAREGTAPGGGQLRNLFEHVGPCVILMDEIINYARNLSGDARIESIYTFFQNVTEAIRQTNNAVMVISLPESEVEVGDERAAEILRRLETILGRVEAVWRPVEDREGFEVVRRRLFRDETCDTNAREQTCQAFADMYNRRNNRTKFPSEVTRPEYTEQIRKCYPIHPEIFDRLYEDWSTYHNFQRTRGVLRIMALCVNRLYHANDDSLLIMPGDVPLGDSNLSGEFIRLLDPHWNPVMDEVDKDGSRTDAIDARRNEFRQIRPARRMARAIFLGSVPVRPNPGLDDRHIYLGAVSPGSPISNYDTALRTMDENLYHLYRENGRHRFSSDVKLALVVNDRRGEFNDGDADDEIIRRLNETCNDESVVICPESNEDVPDVNQSQVVLLKPDQMRGPRNRETDKATPAAETILKGYRNGPRIHRSTLRFVATNTDRVRPLRDAARNVLVWDSIINGERKVAHLTEQRQKEAKDELDNAQNDFDKALEYAYRYIATPQQIGDSDDNYTFSWSTMRGVPQNSRISDNIAVIVQNQHSRQQEAISDTVSPTDIDDVYDVRLEDDNDVDNATMQNSGKDVDMLPTDDHAAADSLDMSSESEEISNEFTISDSQEPLDSEATAEDSHGGSTGEVFSDPIASSASLPDVNFGPVVARLRFTPLNSSESLDARFIGNGLADELRRDGSLVTVTITATIATEIGEIPRPNSDDYRALIDDGVQNISSVTFVVEAKNHGGIPGNIVQYMRDIADSKRFVTVEIE